MNKAIPMVSLMMVLAGILILLIQGSGGPNRPLVLQAGVSIGDTMASAGIVREDEFVLVKSPKSPTEALVAGIYRVDKLEDTRVFMTRLPSPGVAEPLVSVEYDRKMLEQSKTGTHTISKASTNYDMVKFLFRLAEEKAPKPPEPPTGTDSF